MPRRRPASLGHSIVLRRLINSRPLSSSGCQSPNGDLARRFPELFKKRNLHLLNLCNLLSQTFVGDILKTLLQSDKVNCADAKEVSNKPLKGNRGSVVICKSCCIDANTAVSSKPILSNVSTSLSEGGAEEPPGTSPPLSVISVSPTKISPSSTPTARTDCAAVVVRAGSFGASAVGIVSLGPGGFGRSAGLAPVLTRL